MSNIENEDIAPYCTDCENWIYQPISFGKHLVACQCMSYATDFGQGGDVRDVRDKLSEMMPDEWEWRDI